MTNTLQAVNHNSKLIEWSKQVEDCRMSGMTVMAWCREHGISPSTFYHRQRKVFEVVGAKQEVCFTEVPVMPSAESSGSAVASVRCGDMSIDIYSGADSETLKAVFETLKLC